jgi:hypothetical protein
MAVIVMRMIVVVMVVVTLMVLMALPGRLVFIAMNITLGVNLAVAAMIVMVMFMVLMIVVIMRLFGLRRIGACTLDHAALDAVAMAAAARIAMPRAASVGAVFAFFLGLAVGALIGFDQRLPVGDRNLVIVGMDFAEGKEAVPVAAIFDEGGLQ